MPQQVKEKSLISFKYNPWGTMIYIYSIKARVQTFRRGRNKPPAFANRHFRFLIIVDLATSQATRHFPKSSTRAAPHPPHHD